MSFTVSSVPIPCIGWGLQWAHPRPGFRFGAQYISSQKNETNFLSPESCIGYKKNYKWSATQQTWWSGFLLAVIALSKAPATSYHCFYAAAAFGGVTTTQHTADASHGAAVPRVESVYRLTLALFLFIDWHWPWGDCKPCKALAQWWKAAEGL